MNQHQAPGNAGSFFNPNLITYWILKKNFYLARFNLSRIGVNLDDISITGIMTLGTTQP
jgi:hypothetical protein